MHSNETLRFGLACKAIMNPIKAGVLPDRKNTLQAGMGIGTGMRGGAGFAGWKNQPLFTCLQSRRVKLTEVCQAGAACKIQKALPRAASKEFQSPTPAYSSSTFRLMPNST